MLVRRRCVPVPPADSAPSRERADRRPWLEDVDDGAYWGGSDLVFEGA